MFRPGLTFGATDRSLFAVRWPQLFRCAVVRFGRREVSPNTTWAWIVVFHLLSMSYFPLLALNGTYHHWTCILVQGFEANGWLWKSSELIGLLLQLGKHSGFERDGIQHFAGTKL